MGWIVLRDIPKEAVQLDGLRFDVAGGFRGFQTVPGGYHLVRVLDSAAAAWASCEVWLDQGAAEVLIYDDSGKLHRAEAARHGAMASSGDLDTALIDVTADDRTEHMLAWGESTSRIDQPVRQIALADRADISFLRAHSDAKAAQRELQAAFVRMHALEDEKAEAYFFYLLQAHYHAGARRIAAAVDYFAWFARTLAAMITVRPSLRTDERATEGSDFLLEDLDKVAMTHHSLGPAIGPLRSALTPPAFDELVDAELDEESAEADKVISLVGERPAQGREQANQLFEQLCARWLDGVREPQADEIRSCLREMVDDADLLDRPFPAEPAARLSVLRDHCFGLALSEISEDSFELGKAVADERIDRSIARARADVLCRRISDLRQRAALLGRAGCERDLGESLLDVQYAREGAPLSARLREYLASRSDTDR